MRLSGVIFEGTSFACCKGSQKNNKKQQAQDGGLILFFETNLSLRRTYDMVVKDHDPS